MPDNSPHSSPHSHFQGKDALGHVIEAQAQGIISAAEVHGVETPGYLSAGCDAARESAVAFALAWLVLSYLGISSQTVLALLLMLSCSCILWKMGRASWLGWFRLERLHRVLEQERWEIEHHRQQERDELRVLYAAKGFEGKLLEDVLDVLMADNDRLLKVMVEEELGLSLASHEHPLKQGLGAALGTLISAGICFTALWVWPHGGIFVGAPLSIALASILSARLAQNNVIPAIIWNLGLAALTFGCLYFLLQFIKPH